MTPWWQALISGAAGAIITLIGVVSGLVVQGRRERWRWEAERIERREERELAKTERLRDRRIDLWSRAIKVAVKGRDLANEVTGSDDFYYNTANQERIEEFVSELDALDPDFQILAPEEIGDVWHELLLSAVELNDLVRDRFAADDLAANDGGYIERCNQQAFDLSTHSIRMMQALRYGMRQIETE